MNINLNKQHLHFAMHPRFAMGHLKPYMQLSNNLAEQGHRVTFFLPSKVHPSISPFNSHPDLITLIPITLPPVSGLDPNFQTTADCDLPAQYLLAAAFDKTAPVIQSHLQTLQPDAIFFDFAHWIPDMAKTLGILSICFYSSPAASLAYLLVKLAGYDRPLPSDFPPACLALSKHENNCVDSFLMGEYGEGITLGERLKMSGTQCDMIAFRTFRELLLNLTYYHTFYFEAW
uniref:Uncharacterized protein n=1 Tax=Kalanchoe fedtschenkoi TaxID=63787 RepID=A0A7N0UH23_KALFE